MAAFKYHVGLQNVGSYQVSGRPWASGSINCRANALGIAQLDFPNVTSFVVISNLDSADNNLRVGFSSGGVAGLTGPALENRYLELPPTTGSGPVRLELKVTQLFLSGSDNCSVIAGLTGIPPNTINEVKANSPSGSNWSGSSGIG
jgi:hypothetical protein|tara:strand:+ start:2365 stop:2802 length:438 start_codon:yes stop_codon:yes gene_type:complete